MMVKTEDEVYSTSSERPRFAMRFTTTYRHLLTYPPWTALMTANLAWNSHAPEPVPEVASSPMPWEWERLGEFRLPEQIAATAH